MPEAEQDLTYQLRATLFDQNHQHFFGRTWKSPPQKMKNSRISFNEVALLWQTFHWKQAIYFKWHTAVIYSIRYGDSVLNSSNVD